MDLSLRKTFILAGAINVHIKNDTFQKAEYCKPVCIENVCSLTNQFSLQSLWQGVKLSEKEVTLKTRQAQEEPLTRDICY